MARVSDRETSFCGDDDATSTSRTPTIIGDDNCILTVVMRAITYRLDSTF